MSTRDVDPAPARLRRNVGRFAALGHETRLSLLLKLGDARALSIRELAEGAGVTRQAITKHLRILEEAGLVRGARRGRERLFRLDPAPLDDAQRALAEISRHWDRALARLRKHVEDG